MKPRPPTKITKHSVMIAGHATSISLEAAFWDALSEESKWRSVPLSALIAQIDSERGQANLSSAIRVHILLFERERYTS